MPQVNSKHVQVFIKVVIVLAVYYFLYIKLRGDQELLESIFRKINANHGSNLLFLLAAAFLIPFNWLLEALKWRLLIKNIEQVSIWNSLRGVLTGLSFAFITPRHLGDYVGRIVSLENRNRIQVVGALLISRVSQLLPTLLFGIISLFYWHNTTSTWEIKWPELILSIIGFALFIVFIVRSRVVFSLLDRWHISSRITRLFKIIQSYKPKLLLSIFGLSILRYLVFTGQYFLICLLFYQDLELISALTGISLVFLSKSVIPSFNFLSDLGVRELAALSFLSNTGMDNVTIICASLSVWILNILLPTLLGTLLSLKAKFRFYNK